MSLLLRRRAQQLVPAPQETATSSYWNPYREPTHEQVKRAFKIGPADPVTVARPSPRVRRVEKQNRQTLSRIAAADLASKQIRAAKLRKIALADDDWLMTM